MDPELLLDDELELPEEPELPELLDLPELLEDFLSLLLFNELLFLELLLPELPEFEDLPLLDERSWTFASRICLVHHSQYWLLMVWARFQSLERVLGLPT